MGSIPSLGVERFYIVGGGHDAAPVEARPETGDVQVVGGL